MSNNNKKYKKYTEDWNKATKILVGKQIEKEFKKGEKKPDGKIVEVDAGENIKVNDFEDLIRERNILVAKLEEKKENLKSKAGYTKEYAEASLKHDNLEEKLTTWKANLKTGDNYTNQHNSFLKTGTGITNPYKTDGWVKKMGDFQKGKFTNPYDSKSYDYFNLYDGCLWNNDNSKSKNVKITEQEARKLIAAFIHQIGKMDKNEFAKLIGIGGSVPSGITLDFKKLDNNPGFNTDVKGWFDTIHDHAKGLIETTDKHTGRKEYEFGHGFLKDENDASQGMKDTNVFNKTSIEALFELNNFLKSNTNWLDHSDVKTKVLKDVEDKTEITVIPAQDTPFTEKQLHDWGVEGYTADSYKNSSKLTGYYGDVKTSEKADEAVKFEIEDGIKGWSTVISHFFKVYHNHLHGKEGATLHQFISSFDTDLYSDFYDQYSTTYDPETESFNDKDTTTPHHYTLNQFPQYYYEQEVKIHALKAEKDALLDEVKTGRKDLLEADKEVIQTKKDLKSKEDEIDAKITEAITNKRNKIKTEFKVSDTETNDFADDNRITTADHYEFQQLVRAIRFLVNGDEETPTGQNNEDQAYQANQEILTKTRSTWIETSWTNIGWVEGATETENYNRSNSEKIKLIKANKDDKYYSKGLNYWHDQLVELEKLVKLSDREQQIKTDLKAAIDNQTPAETLADWQNTLKKYDADLATIFSQAKLAQWKEKKDGQAKFDNLAALETLLKKVWVADKIEAGFITALKKLTTKKADGTEETGSIDTLAKLIEQKDPVDVIKIIVRYAEYDKLSEDEKKIKKQKLVWTLEKKDQKGQYLDDDDLTGEEITQVLYEIAIGKKTLASQKKTDSSNSDETQAPEGTKSWWKFGSGNVGRPLFTYTMILLGMAGVAAAIFWKRITEWWNGPAEEAATEETAKTEEDD